MAVDHATIGTDLGKFLLASEQVRKFRDDNTGAGVTIKCLQVILDDFETTFDADATHKFILESCLEWVRSARVHCNQMVQELWDGPVSLWLQEYVKVQIASSAQSVQGILRDWGEAMLTDGEDLEALTITVSSVTADGDNSGDGTVTVISKEPLEDRPNEVAHTEKFTLRCRQSAFNGGATPGEEVFELSGSVHKGGADVPVKFTEGIDKNRIQNGGFENFTTGVPDNWTEVTGASLITQDSTNYDRDSNSLKVDGDGATATIELKQPETSMAGYSTTARLAPRRHYQINARIKTNNGSGIAVGDTFSIYMDGTGYSTGAGEKISIAGADAVTWTEYKATVIMPKTVPSDMALHIKYEGTPAAGDFVNVDDLVLQEFTVWEEAGIAVAITRGPTNDFVSEPQEDYFTFNTTNSEDKIFQRWLIRVTDESTSDIRTWPGFNRMLPTAASASAAYAESKAG